MVLEIQGVVLEVPVMFVDVKVAFLDVPVVVLMVWGWFWWSGGGFGGQGGISGGPGDISEGLRHGLEVKEAFLEVRVVFVVVWEWSWRSPRRFWRSRQRFWRPRCWFWQSGADFGGQVIVLEILVTFLQVKAAFLAAGAHQPLLRPSLSAGGQQFLPQGAEKTTRWILPTASAPAGLKITWRPRHRLDAETPRLNLTPPGWGVGGVSRAGSGLC